MLGEHFVDLDELILRCRSEQAKQYIAEAVACYRASAFRGCIVMTWTAIVFDFLHKLRDLELSGDKNATRHLQQFENIRTANDMKRSLDFERQMLSDARDDFVLISHIEYADLERLREDRNRCAHPSLQVSGEPYQPTAELARYHLRNAVSHFLQHPPVQGKAAYDLIWNDIESVYFPTDTASAVNIFKKGLLARARQPLIREMIIGLTKDLVKKDLTAREYLQYFSALNAILEIYREIGEKVLFEELPKIVRDVNDPQWPKVITYLRNVSIGWEALGEPGRIKATNVVTTIDINYATLVISDALYIPSLKKVASARVPELPTKDLLAAQSQLETAAEYVDTLIERFSNANTFKSAKIIGEALLPYATLLTAKQVKTIANAFISNPQIYHSFGLRDIIGEIFKQTDRYGKTTKAAWRAVHTRLLTDPIADDDELTNLIEERYSDIQ